MAERSSCEESMFRRYHEAYIEYCVGRLHIEPDDPELALLKERMKAAWREWLFADSFSSEDS